MFIINLLKRILNYFESVFKADTEHTKVSLKILDIKAKTLKYYLSVEQGKSRKIIWFNEKEGYIIGAVPYTKRNKNAASFSNLDNVQKVLKSYLDTNGMRL